MTEIGTRNRPSALPTATSAYAACGARRDDARGATWRMASGGVAAQPTQCGLRAASWQRPLGAPGMTAEHDNVRTQPLLDDLVSDTTMVWLYGRHDRGRGYLSSKRSSTSDTLVSNTAPRAARLRRK